MTEKNDNNSKRKYYFAEIFITQAICISLILLIIFICKYFFKNEYIKLEKFYKKYICTQTTVEEVAGTDEVEK